MSNRSRSSNRHQSSLHAFFLAAKEKGYTEFQLQLITNPKGRIEFCISPQRRSEMSAKFEVRGNMVRAAAKEASAAPTADDTEARVDYGGTRSGVTPFRPISTSDRRLVDGWSSGSKRCQPIARRRHRSNCLNCCLATACRAVTGGPEIASLILGERRAVFRNRQRSANGRGVQVPWPLALVQGRAWNRTVQSRHCLPHQPLCGVPADQVQLDKTISTSLRANG
jgi:hypothetical protein